VLFPYVPVPLPGSRKDPSPPPTSFLSLIVTQKKSPAKKHMFKSPAKNSTAKKKTHVRFKGLKGMEDDDM